MGPHRGEKPHQPPATVWPQVQKIPSQNFPDKPFPNFWTSETARDHKMTVAIDNQNRLPTSIFRKDHSVPNQAKHVWGILTILDWQDYVINVVITEQDGQNQILLSTWRTGEMESFTGLCSLHLEKSRGEKPNLGNTWWSCLFRTGP